MSLAKKISLRPAEEILEIVHQAGRAYFWRYLFGLAIILGVSFFVFWFLSFGWMGYTAFGLGILLGLSIIISARSRQNSNYWVLTSERLVDIDRPKIFSETVSSAHFDDIKNIYLQKKGAGARILNYGSVVVETNDNEFMLIAQNISRPHRLIAALTEAKSYYRGAKKTANQSNVLKELSRMIPQLSVEELLEIKNRVVNRLEDIGERVDAASDEGDEA